MKLTLRNVAKVENAELKLDGITVIAGENNTGKSTIGRTVFSLFNALVNIEEKIERQKQQMIFQHILRSVMMNITHEDNLMHSTVSPMRIRRYARMIAQMQSDDEYREALYGLLKGVPKEVANEKFVEGIIEEINKIKSLPVERLTKSAVAGYFDKVFYSEINNAYRPDENTTIDAVIKDREIRIEFVDNHCVDVQQQINIINEAVYLDNPFILNDLNKSMNDFDEIEAVTINKLRMSTDAVEDVVQYSLMTDKIQGILEKLSEVTSGTLFADETQTYHYKENGKKLNIINLSAGLKSFVVIKSLLEKGALKERDVLILDEPEIHLHPEWQLRYAEIIVLLQEMFDFTILLTTHSAHFLEAIDYFAKKHNVHDKCNYYLSGTGEYGCVLEDVTDDLSKIYAQLVEPSILLDKLKYKMEEEQDE